MLGELEKCFEEDRNLDLSSENEKLCRWKYRQVGEYKNSFGGMSSTNMTRRKIWEEFTEKWKQKFIDQDAKWEQTILEIGKMFRGRKSSRN
jgi:hypothetical protein